MDCRRHLNPWLLPLLCVALLVVRVSGTHLHLCFDGAGPFASVHTLNCNAAVADPEPAVAHHEDDVSLIGDSLSGSGKIGLELPTLLTIAFVLCAAVQPPRQSEPAYRSALAASTRRFLLPPPRAPPRR